MDLAHIDFLLSRPVFAVHIVIRAKKIQQILFWDNVAVAVSIMHVEFVLPNPVDNRIRGILGDAGDILHG